MKIINIQELVDQAKFNRFHGLVIFWASIILVIDGYDIAVTGAALPAIMNDLQISATTAGALASASLIGMACGSALFGVLADRFGRKVTVAVSVASFSLLTAAAGLVRDPITFGILRFLAGLGLGGLIPILISVVAEYAPRSIRTRSLALFSCGYAVGGVAAALLGKGLIESHGWQAVFFAAGTPVLLIPFLLNAIPESLTLLIKQGRHAELREIVSKIDPSYPIDERTRFGFGHERHGEGSAAISIGKIFQDGRAVSTVMLWVANFCGLFMLYALNTWLTKLMGALGYSLDSALNFLIYYNVGAVLGATCGGWLSDKAHPKWVLFAFYGLAAVSLIAIASGLAPNLLTLLVIALGAFTLGTQILTNAYGGMFYPNDIRTTAVGLNYSAGRIGGMLAPVFIGGLVALQLTPQQSFLAIAVASVVGAVAVATINHRASAAVQSAPDAGRASELADNG
ncbi:MFS transporter [Pseudomonas sp. WN033]|nr:MFS transporter [Pseudomonas sp. WN033]